MSLNINSINYEDFKDICRMCMFNCGIKFYRNNVVSSIFHKLTDLHFETNDDLPKQICRKCFAKINEIHEFAVQCKQTHSALMECLNNQKNVIQNETINKCIENNSLYLTENNVHGNNQMEIKNEIIEEKNDIIPETSEINEDAIENIDIQITSYNLKEEITISENKIEFIKVEHVSDEEDLLISNKSNINVESNNSANQNDLNEDTISSNIYLEEINKNEEKTYKCDQCAKSFNYLNNRRYPGRQHDGERPYTCSQCSKSPNQSGNLKDRTHKCEKCSKTFKYLSKLRTHLRVHSDERKQCSKSFAQLNHLDKPPYKCSQCSKSFIQPSYLQQHMRTHTGERPNECPQCEKSFLRLWDLKRHLQTHTDERPYKCPQCSKLFTQPNVLKRHMYTHTGERPYKCKQCSKSFTQACHLKSHVLTHSDERPYKCKQCLKSFAQSSFLKRHMRIHRKSDETTSDI